VRREDEKTKEVRWKGKQKKEKRKWIRGTVGKKRGGRKTTAEELFFKSTSRAIDAVKGRGVKSDRLRWKTGGKKEEGRESQVEGVD